MLELVSWLQDAAPHRRGIIRAAVFQGESQSTAAGPTLDGVTADPWSVKVPITDDQRKALAVGFKILELADGINALLAKTFKSL